MKPMTVLYIVLATVAGMAFGAWFAGSQIKSPAEVAARTAAPEPSPILVPIEKRVLSSDVVTRGTVRFGLPQPISIVPSTLKAASGLIATLALPNQQFKEGDVMLTASGRPVFVLLGKSPIFRDLAPGVTGEDVRQLEQALQRLGFDPGKIDGVYDQQTSEAVKQWYEREGWAPFVPTRQQTAAVRVLERNWADARRSRLGAASVLATSKEVVGAARAAADQAIKAAMLERSARAADKQHLLEAGQTGKSLSIESERAKAEFADSAAAADIAAQVAELARISLDPRQSNTARAAADAKLALARQARESAKLQSRLAIRAVKNDIALARARIELADAVVEAARLEGKRSVQAAREALNLAKFDLKIASERANRAESEYKLAKRKLGVLVPADELVFVASLPVRVEKITAAVGKAAAGTVMTVTDNQLAVDSALPLDVATMIKPGIPVAIDEQTLGKKAKGVVSFVANAPGTRGVDGYHFYFETRVEDSGSQLKGVSVRLTIPIESTQGEVLAVPVSAVSLAADGSSRMQVHNKETGALDYVAVTPGLAAGGFVEITTAGKELTPGQLVVVGYKNPKPRF